MAFPTRIVSGLALLALASVTQAATGGINGVSASASTVTAGDTVDFSVSFSLSPT